MNYWLYFLPFIAAFIGWLLHFALLQYFINAIIPKKKKHWGNAVATIAAKEFASFKGLEEKINDPKNLEAVLPMIETHLDHFLNEKLKKEMPVISMFVGSKTTDKLKEVFMKEIQLLFPQIIAKFASNLQSSIPVETIVRKKIEDITPSHIRSWMNSNLRKELSYIPLIGALAGFITGLLQLIITILTS